MARRVFRDIRDPGTPLSALSRHKVESVAGRRRACGWGCLFVHCFVAVACYAGSYEAYSDLSAVQNSSDICHNTGVTAHEHRLHIVPQKRQIAPHEAPHTQGSQSEAC